MINVHIDEETVLPFVVSFAIEFGVPDVTGMIQWYSTETACQTLLMPASISYSH